MRGFLLAIFGALLVCATHSGPASALTRTFINCPNGPPCAMDLQAHIDAIGPAHLPWMISVAVPANLCFVVTINSGDSDAGVKLSVLAPNGTVYRSTGTVDIPKTMQGLHTVQIDSVPPAAEQIVEDVHFSLSEDDFTCEVFSTPGT